jgi:hypothetical protein
VSAIAKGQLFNTNVNSCSPLGEVKFWANDYDAATNILSKVAAATSDWKLPTSFSGPPTNLQELFDLTTAQVRTYTTLAALYLSQNDFESALPRATKAERGYADVFYVAHHPLYGPFVPAAHGFLDAVNFRAPKLTVDAIKAQSLLEAGATKEAAGLASRLTTLAAR